MLWGLKIICVASYNLAMWGIFYFRFSLTSWSSEIKSSFLLLLLFLFCFYVISGGTKRLISWELLLSWSLLKCGEPEMFELINFIPLFYSSEACSDFLFIRLNFSISSWSEISLLCFFFCCINFKCIRC